MAKQSKVTNQKAAAAILRKEMGIDQAQADTLVKRARDGGCTAFDHRGCIDVQGLRKWIAANQEELSIEAPLSLKDQKLNEEIRKLRIANDIKENKTVDVQRVIGVIYEIAGVMKPFGDQKFTVELPAYMTNDVQHNRIICKRAWDEFGAKAQGLSHLWKALLKR